MRTMVSYDEFYVVCTNPAKSAHVESMRCVSEDITEQDAIEVFAEEHGLDASEIRIEPIDDESGEVIIELIHETAWDDAE